MFLSINFLLLIFYRFYQSRLGSTDIFSVSQFNRNAGINKVGTAAKGTAHTERSPFIRTIKCSQRQRIGGFIVSVPGSKIPFIGRIEVLCMQGRQSSCAGTYPHNIIRYPNNSRIGLIQLSACNRFGTVRCNETVGNGANLFTAVIQPLCRQRYVRRSLSLSFNFYSLAVHTRSTGSHTVYVNIFVQTVLYSLILQVRRYIVATAKGKLGCFVPTEFCSIRILADFKVYTVLQRLIRFFKALIGSI